MLKKIQTEKTEIKLPSTDLLFPIFYFFIVFNVKLLQYLIVILIMNTIRFCLQISVRG